MKLAVPLWAVIIMILLASCAGGGEAAEPPAIAYGQDVCDRCGMIISEEKYAAAYWTEGGEARRFDDIGGMMAYLGEVPEEVASFWVHDYHSAAWIRGEEATYLVDGALMTPMGFGIAAFASADQARAMAEGRDTVQVVSFEQLREMEMMMPATHSHSMGAADQG